MKIDSSKIKPYILTAGILAADQITKAIIVANWPIPDGRVIKDVFGNDLVTIIHVRNPGIAFSIGQNIPDVLRPILFVLFPLIVLGLLVWYSMRSNEFTKLQRWAIAGIVGGGLGNLIDRAFRPGGVVDFVSVKIFGLFGMDRWPTFNVADSSVVVCGILLVISMFLPQKKLEEAK